MLKSLLVHPTSRWSSMLAPDLHLAPTRGFHSAPHRYRDTEPSDARSIALAKTGSGEANEIDPARSIPRSHHALGKKGGPT
jgi:hypothetical protein